MQLKNLLLLTGFLAATAMPVLAADDLQPVTIEVNTSTGTFASGGNFRSKWTSNATPGIELSCGVNNFKAASEGDLQYYVGSAGSSTITITPRPDRYYISSYSFEFKLVGGGNVTLSANGGATQTATTAYQSVNVSNVAKGTACEISFNGDNEGVYLHNFRVTLTPDADYEEPVYNMLSSTIENGEFNEWATWFNLEIAANGYSFYNNGEELMTLGADQRHLPSGSEYEWCFVEQTDGTYKIYNRQSGTSKVLAAPKGGTGYPRMMAEGNNNFTYTWNVAVAKYDAAGNEIAAGFNGKYPMYISLSDNPSAILNYINESLDFWTGGFDNGSVVVPVVSETKVAVDLTDGYLTRSGVIDNSNRWQSLWHVDGNFNFTFGTSRNNMTTSTGDPTTGVIWLASGGSSCGYNFSFPNSDFYVSDISLNASMSGATGTGTLAIGSHTYELSGTTPTAINIEGIAPDGTCGFMVTAPNDLDHNIAIADMVVKVKRYARVYEPGVNVFIRQGHRERRIPALAVTGKSGRIIAVYDYRWNGGDLGGGNIDLQIATSDDGGLTWTEPDHAKNAEGQPVTEYDHSFDKTQNDWNAIRANSVGAWNAAWGDAAICGDRESDDVMLLAVGGPIGFWASTRNNPQSAIRWTSKDGGLTWSEAENITEKIYSLFDGSETFGGVVNGMFFGSGRVCQSRYVKVGKYFRMYSVISAHKDGINGQTRNFVLYTDDLGESWHVLGGVDNCPVSGSADEPKAEELPDGSVLLAARGRSGNRNFNIFRYTNPTTGEGRWDNFINTNMGMGSINACDGEIFILPVRNTETGEQCFMALQSFPYGGGRNNVSIAWKPLAEGADFSEPNCFTSWGGRYQVCSGSSAYSTMVLTHEKRMGFFFEQELTGSYDGVYKNLPIDIITNGRYKYCPDFDNEQAKALTLDLVKYRMANYSGSNAAAVTAAGEAYIANPTYANYIAFNRAEYGYDGTPDSYDFDYNTVLWPGIEPGLESIAIDPATAAVKAGETIELNVVLTPASAEPREEIVWTSSDETVATVDNGTVSGLNEGTAVITATAGAFSATCTVTVEPDEEDAISEIIVESGINSIFDLQGRRVVSPGRGIYIVNGRKAVVK